MQKFQYDLLMDDSYSVIGYEGDEPIVKIPKGGFNGTTPVKIIYDRLFQGHSEITGVELPDTVTDIGEFVFDGCDNLRSISLPDSLQNIWCNAFARSGIEHITIPNGVKTIAPYVFRDCKNLKTVDCGSGITKINGCAFYGCTYLEKIIVPKDAEILPNAFDECGHEVEVVRV